ncbi:MAG: hypothetical protein M3127_04915 [Actinomycetota bacterium]|nr:hypothetical protein [Actinomycetota bacterium]
MNEEDLARYLTGTVDPAAAVADLPERSLAELADALYRHLDTPNPAFGAHSWYTQVAEELQLRRITGEGRLVGDSAAQPEDHGPAGQEVPVG